jgi:hypothetical protein
VIRILFLTLAVGFIATRAQAEAFDCSRPGPPAARIVCGDAALHAADQAESAAYDSALSAALDRPSLREDERLWFQSEILTADWFVAHGMSVDPGKLLQAYQARADALRAITRRWRDLRRPLAADRLGTACLALPPSSAGDDCHILDSGSVTGMGSLRYQRQSYGQEAKARAVVVFAVSDTAGDQWVPIAAAYNAHADFSAPETVDSPYGKLMMLAGEGDGPQDESVSSLYRFSTGTLEDIDDRTWLDTLRSRLPDGLVLDPDVVADYGKMTAIATIARSQSTCCPVGGHAVVTLAIENQSVVVKDVTFAPQ